MVGYIAPWGYDAWAPFRGKFPEPTAQELGFIREFLGTFPFEKDDFVEDERYSCTVTSNGVVNTRQLLIQLLHQIRESKGYDVEHYVRFFSPFDPSAASRDEYHRDRATEAVRVAISTINTQLSGKMSLELVSVDRCVWTRPNRCYLLTLTVKEVDEEDVIMLDVDAPEIFKTIRAMVFSQPDTSKLIEWKYK